MAENRKRVVIHCSCGYMGATVYSIVLCGELCPRCRGMALPDLIREHIRGPFK